jgi:endonuclease G
MKNILYVLFLIFFSSSLSGQNFQQQLQRLQAELLELHKAQSVVEQKIEKIELEELKQELRPFLPPLQKGEQLIDHSLLYLVYSETHEQAKWVAHIISPKIIAGQVTRSNDFRRDPKITSGSAEESDYFLKFLQGDSSYSYDGFGYDRGHLAPSADFRWSPIALSESYYYSNMSPQTAEFNRGIWADLENALRGYIFKNPNVKLYVFTGPVLSDDLATVERSTNRLSIPKFYWKVALDLQNKKMIGFLLPNIESSSPLHTYIRPVDEIEALTGIDFIPYLDDALEEQLEQQSDALTWLGEAATKEVSAISATSLPKNHFNTVQARRYMGSNEEVSICGTAVDARKSRSDNVLINLDQRYPNQVFTVFIRKENVVNFGQDPVTFWIDKKVCATGKVASIGGTPTIFLEHEHQLKALK